MPEMFSLPEMMMSVLRLMGSGRVRLCAVICFSYVMGLYGLFGILTTLPLFWSLPTEFVAGTCAAAGLALINWLGNLASFASPSAVGWLKEATCSADAMVLQAALALSVPKRMKNS